MNNFANWSGVFSVLIDLNPVKNTELVFRVNLQKTSDLINFTTIYNVIYDLPVSTSQTKTLPSSDADKRYVPQGDTEH